MYFQSLEWITIWWQQRASKTSVGKPWNVLVSVSPGGKSLPHLRVETVDLPLSMNSRNWWAFCHHSGVFRLRFWSCLGEAFFSCPYAWTGNIQLIIEKYNSASGLACLQEDLASSSCLAPSHINLTSWISFCEVNSVVCVMNACQRVCWTGPSLLSTHEMWKSDPWVAPTITHQWWSNSC